MARVVVTERDKNLFKSLNNYGFLSTKQVRKLFFNGVDKRTMLARLRALRKAKYLRFITGPELGQYVWYLSKAGSKLFDSEPVIGSVNRNTLEHDLLVNELRFLLKDTGLFSNWTSSHRMRKYASDYFEDYDTSEPIVPDWISSLEFKDQGKKPIAIELELNYKGPKYMDRLFSKYVRQRSLSGVWYFVKDASVGKRVLEDYRKHYYQHGENWVWFSLISDMKSPIEEIKINTRSGSFLLKSIAEKKNIKAQLTYEEFMKNKNSVGSHQGSHGVGS
jgi:hypothetical protein